MLKQFEMKKCKLVSTLMKLEVANTLILAIDEADDATIKWYQQLIKSSMWSAVHIKPDLTYSVRVLSRYVHNLSFIHCILIKRMLKYVVETLNVELKFSKKSQNDNTYSNNSYSEDDLIDYNDSNFADLKDKCHSIDEYVFILADEAIYHSSKQQQTIALSSCEAEYMTLS